MLSIVSIIITLITLIIIHELGHFIAAKALGVKVTKFSVGFGPAIIKKQYKETEYVFAPILLGGYIKLLGENFTSVVENEDKSRAYCYQPIWKRLIIIVSGVTANAIFAIIVLFFIALINESKLSPSMILSSLMQTTTDVVKMMVEIATVLWGIFTGAVSINALGGPVTVFSIAGAKAQAGIQDYAYFLAVLSVNLSVFNLLPIPILDGGHIVLLSIEAIVRHKPGVKTTAVWNTIGMIVIMLLMITVFFVDISRVY